MAHLMWLEGFWESYLVVFADDHGKRGEQFVSESCDDPIIEFLQPNIVMAREVSMEFQVASSPSFLFPESPYLMVMAAAVSVDLTGSVPALDFAVHLHARLLTLPSQR
jgi:hypothetical protein